MKIIAAIDGTKYSQAAIDALVGIKWSADTGIKILTVLPAEEPALAFVRSGVSTKTAQQYQEITESTRNALKNRLGTREQALGCVVSYEVTHGDAKEQIVEAAKRWSANMIIMGSRGNKGLEMMLLGSVSQGVLMHAPCPVIIVKSNASADEQDRKHGFKTILIAVDNSAYSDAAVNWMKDLKWPDTTKLNLVSVVHSLADSINGPQDAVMVSELMMKQESTVSMAEAELKSLAQGLSGAVKPENISVQVAVGDPREAILQAAAACSADLIVMGSHGRTGLTKLFIGSVSQAVAVHSPCSVAIVRGLVPKGKIGELNQSGLFVADK